MSTLDFTPDDALTQEDLDRYEEIERQAEIDNEAYGVELLLRMRSQRMQNLDRANVVRNGIAEVKREIRDGTLSVGEALSDPRSASIRTSVLLQQQHRWGPRRADVVCNAVGINPIRRVGELTDRQRTALAACLSEGNT